MITEKELEQIYSIVDKFGGEQKPTLKARIAGLINRHDRDLKKRILSKLDEL